MFSCSDCEPASNFAQANSQSSCYFLARPVAEQPSAKNGIASICPEKVFQAQMIQPSLGFFASVSAGRD